MLVAGGRPSSRRPTTSALSKYPPRQAGGSLRWRKPEEGKRHEKEKGVKSKRDSGPVRETEGHRVWSADQRERKKED